MKGDDDREGYMKPRKARRNRVLLGLVCVGVIYMTLGRMHLWTTDTTSRPGADTSGRVSHRHPTKLALLDQHTNTRVAELYDYSYYGDDQASPIVRAPLPPYVAEHTTLANGLFIPNMTALNHPIYQLIHESRAAWDAKVARQSKSLAEAVKEYRRRYKMEPPKGYDKWWAFIVYVFPFHSLTCMVLP